MKIHNDIFIGMIARTAFENESITGFPTLAIVSLTMLDEFKEEFKKLLPKHLQKRIIYMHKNHMDKDPKKSLKKLSKLNRNSLKDIDLVVTTYDFVRATCYEFGFEEEVQEFAETNANNKGNVVAIHERTYDQGIFNLFIFLL